MEEQEPLGQEQMNEMLFMQIVVMFHGAALQHMGKVMNPVTQKVERDMAQAKGAIDLLGMLQAKTAGNLSQAEQQMLEHTLFELQMNYVDEVNKDRAQGEEKGVSEDGASEGEASGEVKEEATEGDVPEGEGETSAGEESA